MAEGRSRQLWQHTSHILAWMGNCHAGKKAYEPRQFDPHARSAAEAATPLNKEESQLVLRAMFIGNGKSNAKGG